MLDRPPRDLPRGAPGGGGVTIKSDRPCPRCGEKLSVDTLGTLHPSHQPPFKIEHQHLPDVDPFWTIADSSGVWLMIGLNNWGKVYA